MNRAVTAISTKANKLGLVYSKKWADDEIELLIKTYSYKTNVQLEKIFNRSKDSIGIKARQLGLKKDTIKYYDTDEFLINVKNLSVELNRKPFYHEVFSQNWAPSQMTVNRYFGGYRNVCKILDLDINVNIFGSKTPCYKSKNNDLCWSKSELIITNFFIDNNIKYEKEIKYSKYINDKRCKEKICDWIINDNIFIEYFGMMNKIFYIEKTKTKIEILQDNKIQFIDLYEKDLKNLTNIFKEFISKQQNP